jgi:hypothetical protein
MNANIEPFKSDNAYVWFTLLGLAARCGGHPCCFFIAVVLFQIHDLGHPVFCHRISLERFVRQILIASRDIIPVDLTSTGSLSLQILLLELRFRCLLVDLPSRKTHQLPPSSRFK